MEFNIGDIRVNINSDCSVSFGNGSEITNLLPAFKPRDRLKAKMAARTGLSPYQPPCNAVSCLLYDQTYTTRPPGWYRQNYMSQVLSSANRMHSLDLVGHHGCINSLAFSPEGDEYLASAGDDRRVLIWRMAGVFSEAGHSLKPLIMDTQHTSNIFSSVFSCDGAYLYTGGDDTELIKHDFTRFQSVSSHQVGMYHHMDSVYCVAPHPSSPNIVYTASQDGCVYIIDTRHARSNSYVNGDMVLCEDTRSYQCVAVNPSQPCLVGVAGSGHGVALYDTRKMKRVQNYHNLTSFTGAGRESAVSVCFNQTGSQLFALYRETGPCLFDLHRTTPTQVFTAPKYRNIVTLKSGSFMGQNDEYVVSGSDDFRVFVWKVTPTGCGPNSARFTEPHLVLPGHRSIVNQIRYSTAHQVLATSGVEKIVKVWSPLPMRGDDVTHKSGDPPSRERFTSRQQTDGEPAEGTEEDLDVLYLFDSMVEQAENGELPDSSNSISDVESLDSDDLLGDFEDEVDPVNLVWPYFWGDDAGDSDLGTEESDDYDSEEDDYSSLESLTTDSELDCMDNWFGTYSSNSSSSLSDESTNNHSELDAALTRLHNAISKFTKSLNSESNTPSSQSTSAAVSHEVQQSSSSGPSQAPAVDQSTESGLSQASTRSKKRACETTALKTEDIESPPKAKTQSTSRATAKPSAQKKTKATLHSSKTQPTPPATKKAKVAPPATKKAKIAPSATKKAKIVPPATKKAKVAPPATKKAKVAPPATKKTKVKEPKSKTSTQGTKDTKPAETGEVKVRRSARKKSSAITSNGAQSSPSEQSAATSGECSQNNGRSKKGKDSSTRQHVRKHPATGSEQGSSSSDRPTTRSRRNIEP